MSDSLLTEISSMSPYGLASAGGVDVQEAVAFGVLGLEEQQLGDDQIRHVVLDHVADENDPFLEQAREDVVGTLASTGLLDDHRHVVPRRQSHTPRVLCLFT